MTEYPRGRPPKCYRKAHRYSECDTCMWLNYCKPKPVPIQANMHFDSNQTIPMLNLFKPEDIP